MLRGQAISTDFNLLARTGRRVQGIAADGVSQIVVRIPANAGEQVTVTILEDDDPETPATESDHSGTLGSPGPPCPGFGCSQLQLTVTGSGTTNGPFAFVVYRAPMDFVTSEDDHELAHRDVYLKIQRGGNTSIVPIKVVRPLVTMIHGIWSSWGMWNTFSPLVNGAGSVDARFRILRVSYDDDIRDRIISSNPTYPVFVSTPKGNSLGWRYNAAKVRSQILEELQVFRTGRNPANMSVAATQTDIIAHSMGGDITRTMPLLPGFLGGNTFRQGIVHKLITLDTPHLGSAVATRVFDQLEAGSPCIAGFLGFAGNYSFRTVNLRGAGVVTGALGDLEDAPMSQALTDLASQQVRRLPIHAIAGIYTDWGRLLWHPYTVFLREVACAEDSLAQLFTPSGWRTVFGPTNNDNDGVVSLTSQRPPGFLGTTFTGYTHSEGMLMLGFARPTIYDAGEVPDRVIELLNTPVTNEQIFRRIPQ
jgi:hypothetical protein